VEVEVEDALTCPGADVGDDPVPGLGDPGAPGRLGRGGEEGCENPAIVNSHAGK
jgi:hypothetical protein